jgi:predicted aspartyl protease
MRLLRISIVFTLACWAHAAAANECTLRNAATLPMLDGYPGRVVVEVSVGAKPRRFLVDTGGVFSSIFQHLADELNLKPDALGSNVQVYNLRGDRARHYVSLPDLAIGPLKGSDVPVLVDEESAFSRSIDGILAPDILSKFDLDFDFANRKLNLVMPDHCAADVVYWANSYADANFDLLSSHIVLTMTLDGKPVTAILDTGSIGTHMFENAARRLFDIPFAPSENRLGESIGLASGPMQHNFQSLSIGGLVVNNPAIRILPDRAAQSFARDHAGDPLSSPRLETTDLLLGMDVIGQLHLYVAYREHKIYLTDAAAHL